MIELKNFSCGPKDIILVSIPLDLKGDMIYDYESIKNICRQIHNVFQDNPILCLPENIGLAFVNTERNPFL